MADCTHGNTRDYTVEGNTEFVGWTKCNDCGHGWISMRLPKPPPPPPTK